MIRFALRGLATHVRGGRVLYLLTVLGVALGVGAVMSIQIINLNALGAFRGTMRAVSGEADLSVVGHAPAFDERLLAEVLAAEGVAAAWPLERTDVVLAGDDNVWLEVLGLDFFSPVRVPWRLAPQGDADPLVVPGWCAVSPEFAAERGLGIGERFEVTSGSRRVTLEIGAIVDFRTVNPTASSRIVVMDIARAQAAFGRRGAIRQIDVALADGADAVTVAAEIERRGGAAVRVVTPRQREQESSRLLAAFRLNLTALSLVSLFVGGFLVYTSVRASLVRRRAEYGLLRSLGATRGQVLGLMLGEVVVLGAVGTAVGLPLGRAAAGFNVDMVSGTLGNLYLLQEIETLRVPAWLFGLAVAVGVGGALVGAILPALETARRDPVGLLADYTIHERTALRAGAWFAAGWAVLIGTTAAWAAFGRGWRPGGFALGIALLVALPMIAPLVVREATRRLRPARLGVLFGVKALGMKLGTTSFAAAALAVAVGLLVGITMMVGSFRETVSIWLDDTLQADIYVTSDSFRRARGAAALAPDVIAALESTPGVRAVDRLRQVTVTDDDGVPVSVVAIDMALPGGTGRFSFYAGDPTTAMQAATTGAALISEPLHRRLGIGVGDRLRLPGPRGPVELPVAGITYDYSNENGGAAIDLTTMERAFGPGPFNSVALYLEPGRDAEVVADGLKRRLAGYPLEIRSYATLRDEVFRLFDQTFAVTRLLQLMSLVIAAAGITLTLLILARERVAELALYRALGAARSQIFAVFLGKGLGIAAFGLGLGAAAGLALAAILVFVINRAYFGWTIAVHWPWLALLEQVLVILAFAVLASVYPAARASRTPATELSRENV